MSISTTKFYSIIIATALLLGVILHEAKIDSLLKAAVVPVVVFTAELSMSLMHGEAHTHVHPVSLKDIHNQTTQLYTRRSISDRYLGKRNALRGRRANEDYCLPISA